MKRLLVLVLLVAALLPLRGDVGARPGPGPWHALGRVYVTGYVDRGLTATGWQAGPGVVAVDPRVVPLGSRVRVAGLGEYRAEDTGRLILGTRLDVWVSTVPGANALTGWYRASWR